MNEQLSAAGSLVNGVTLGSVMDTKDPHGLGRVKVSFSLMGKQINSDWVLIMSMFAGPDSGAFFLPQVGDMALLAFANGNASAPYVLGFLWNGVQKPPVPQAQQQDVRIIKTRQGKSLTLDDSQQGKIVLQDEKGNKIEIDSAQNNINVVSKGNVSVTAQGNMTLSATGTLKLSGLSVEIEQSAAVNAKLTASGVQINGGANVAIKGGIVTLN